MNLVLHKITREDKLGIFNLLKKISQFKEAEIEIAKELIGENLSKGIDSGYHILVAEVDGVISGYICYGPTPLTESTWDIYWEAVAPECQGCGVGSYLIKEAEKNIRMLGGTQVIIETSSTPDYEKTRNFYNSKGYSQISCILDFYKPGDHMTTYCKKLV